MYDREKILPNERTKWSRDWMQTVPSTKREEIYARYGVDILKFLYTLFINGGCFIIFFLLLCKLTYQASP